MLQAVLEAVEVAGKNILEVYDSDDFGIECKEDDSPLTKADRLAHEVLVEKLTALDSGPILSEEDANIPWDERKTWSHYWLVDPLDGTKEFIKRNGEFTVNVAYIENGVPILGVVYAPAKSLWYYAAKSSGAFKKTADSEAVPISPSPLPKRGEHWRVVGSRSHSSKDFDDFMAHFSNADLVSMGSSLKLCLVADGSADLYPRLIPTSEWDTAAAQAVVEVAGGKVLNWETKKPLRYNTKSELLNPYFVVCATESEVWLNK